MALVIPEGFTNLTIHIVNNGGGVSSDNTIALGFEHNVPMYQGLFDLIANYTRDSLKPLLDNSWEFGPCQGVEGTSAGPPRVWSDDTQEAGTHAADTYCPPQVAHVVQKITGYSGKKWRGRCYLPGVPDGYGGEDGGLNPARVTEVADAFNDLLTLVLAWSELDGMALFHDDSTPGPTTPTGIITFKCSSTLGTMRPRLRR